MSPKQLCLAPVKIVLSHENLKKITIIVDLQENSPTQDELLRLSHMLEVSILKICLD